MTVCYSHTTKNLYSITNSLTPKKGDRVLTIGRSGDIGFAMLSLGAQVKIIDLNLDQIDFIKRRVSLICSGDFSGFLHINPTWSPDNNFSPNQIESMINSRNCFFSSNVLNRIRLNLENLSFADSDDIFSFLKTDPNFNKIYFSDVLDHSRNSYAESMKILSGILRLGTFCYTSRSLRDGSQNSDVSYGNLLKNEVRTAAARSSEMNWFSTVYEQVAN